MIAELGKNKRYLLLAALWFKTIVTTTNRDYKTRIKNIYLKAILIIKYIRMHTLFAENTGNIIQENKRM